MIEKQERIAKNKEKNLIKAKKISKVYERVQYEIRNTTNDLVGESTDKMHTVKSIGKRLEKERENCLNFPIMSEFIFFVKNFTKI